MAVGVVGGKRRGCACAERWGGVRGARGGEEGAGFGGEVVVVVVVGRGFWFWVGVIEGLVVFGGLDLDEAWGVGWRGWGWGCGGFAAVVGAVSVSGEDAPGGEDAHVVCAAVDERKCLREA